MGATVPQAAPASADTFQALYDSQFDWLYRTLRRLGARHRDLEDLAHDVFVVVYRQLDTYDPTRPMRPWLFGIAFRVVSNYRRKAGFSRELPSTPEVIGDGPLGSAPPTQEAALQQSRDRALVLQALDALNLDQRAVFVLHELEGIAIPDIAKDLGLSQNTLYSRLRLGRRKFAEAIERLVPGGER